MAKKWVIRNKVAAMGIAAAVICLIIGIIFTAIYEQKKKQAAIASLLTQGEQARAEGRYEEAEETFFSVLGLEMDNEKARRGIAAVSGKALAIKNKGGKLRAILPIPSYSAVSTPPATRNNNHANHDSPLFAALAHSVQLHTSNTKTDH